jgi:dUTP pyrophosphatase
MEKDGLGPRVGILLSPGARRPEYQTPDSSGADLRAFLPEPMRLGKGMRAAVPTGIRLEIPRGWEAQVRPRSGLALKNGISCLNSPGTIDADYRGELKVILVNHSEEDFEIRDGDRIAQIVFAPAFRAGFDERAELSDSERGSGGFGSTGI